MLITIVRGFSSKSYKECSFDFDDKGSIFEVFKPKQVRTKIESEHFRCDVFTKDGKHLSYGCFLDIDNKDEKNHISYKEVRERLEASRINYLSYKTFSGMKDNKDRFRIFIPFKNPCPGILHKMTVQKIAELLFLRGHLDKVSFEYKQVMFAPSYLSGRSEEDTQIYYYNQGRYFIPVDSININFTDREKSEILNQPAFKKPSVEKNSIRYSYITNVSIEEALQLYCKDIYLPTNDPRRYRYFESTSAAGVQVFKKNNDDRYAGKIFSWHAKDPYRLQFMDAFDVLVIFGMGGDKRKAIRHAEEVHRKRFLASHSAELAFQNIQIGTGKWFYYNMIKESPGLLRDIQQDTFGKKTTIKKNSRLLASLGAEDLAEDNPYADIMSKEDREERYEEIKDEHITFIKDNLSDYGRKKVTTNTVQDFIRYFCRDNSYDSLRDHITQLSSEKWDGKVRAKHLFTLLGAKSNAYNEAVALVMLAGLWYRGMLYNNNEVKFDYVVILEGSQGIGKSSLLKKLCGDPELFTDDTRFLGSRNNKIHLSRKWVAELGELSAFYQKGNNVLDVKSFISQTTDSYRPPWGTSSIDVPRRYILIGSTNRNEGYLKDFTGNRRFLPVECFKTEKDSWLNNPEKEDEVTEYFAQLWSEVKYLHNEGVLQKYLVLPKELETTAIQIQKTKELASINESRILDYLRRKVPLHFEKDISLAEIKGYEKWSSRGENNLKVRPFVCIEELMDALFHPNLLSSKPPSRGEIAKVLTDYGWHKGEDIGKAQRVSYGVYNRKVVYYNPEVL